MTGVTPVKTPPFRGFPAGINRTVRTMLRDGRPGYHPVGEPYLPGSAGSLGTGCTYRSIAASRPVPKHRVGIRTASARLCPIQRSCTKLLIWLHNIVHWRINSRPSFWLALYTSQHKVLSNYINTAFCLYN